MVSMAKNDVPIKSELKNEVKDLIENLSRGKLPPNEFEQKISKTSEEIARNKETLDTASVIGAALLGTATGTFVDFTIAGNVDPAIPPAIAATTFAGGAYYLTYIARLPEVKAGLVQYLGAPTLRTGEALRRKALDTIAAQQRALIAKKDATIEYIESIPSRVKQSIDAAVEDTKTRISNKIEDTKNQVS